MFKLFRIKNTELPIFLFWLLIASLYIRPYNGIMQPFYNMGNYAIFFYSTYIVVDKWNFSGVFVRNIWKILVSGVLFLIISRLLNGYRYESQFTSIFLYNIALINLFTFGILDNTWAKLKGFGFLLLIYIVINFITIYIFPDGMYQNDLYTQNWFLGYKNVMIRTILPGITLIILCAIHDYGKVVFMDYFLIGIAMISIYLAESSTSLVMMVVFVLGILFWSFKRKEYNFSLFKCFIVTMCISVAFTMFSLQSFLSSILESLFEKDTTFTGRTYVWAYTLLRLMSSPFIGFGWHSADEWREVLGFYDIITTGFSHPHNFILYMLLQGGLIYLGLFIYLCYYISKTFDKLNSYSYVLTLMYLTFFVEGITESLTGAVLFMPFLGLYAVLKIEKK